jgi:hypothetical protein
MKKEIVRLRKGYVARVKKWYQLEWRYIGIYKLWPFSYLDHESFPLCYLKTEDQARQRLHDFFPKKLKQDEKRNCKAKGWVCCKSEKVVLVELEVFRCI